MAFGSHGHADDFAKTVLASLTSVLSQAGKPDAVCAALAQLMGARTLAIVLACDGDSDPLPYRLLSVAPTYRAPQFETPEGRELLEAGRADGPTFLNSADANDAVGAGLERLDEGVSLIMPIIVAGRRHGAVLALGLDDRARAESLVELCPLLSATIHAALNGVLPVMNGLTSRTGANPSDESTESDGHYRALFENAGDAIIIVDTETAIILDANRTAETMLGRPRDEIVGKNRAILHPQKKELLEGFAERVAEVHVSDVESTVITRDGRLIPVSISSTVFDVGGRRIIEGIFRDATDRVRAVEALRESEALLHRMADNYPNSYISIVEADYTIGFTAGQGFAKHGLDPGQFVGMSLEQVFGEHAPTVRKHYERTFAGEACSFELFINDQHQLYKTVPLQLEDGAIPRILTVAENITERRRAEEELRSSERRYHRLFEEMAAGCSLQEIVSDDTGKPVDYVTLEVNRSFEWLLGTTREAAVGVLASKILPPEELRYWLQIFGPVALEEKSTVYEMYSPLNNKHFEGTAYCPQKGQFAVTFSDVTERKRAEKALHVTQSAVDNAAISIFWLNPDGRFVYANEMATKSIGYTQDEILSRHVWDIDPVFVQERWVPFWQDFKRQRAMHFESTHRRKDGSTFAVDISATHLVHDGQETAFAFVQDLTDRQKAQGEIASLARFPGENPSPVLRVSRDGSIIYANKASMQLLHDWGRDVGDMLPAGLYSIVSSACESEKTTEVELSFGKCNYSFMVTPIPGEGYANLYARDITRQKVAEDRLRQAQKMEAIGRLAGGVAHDFNNMLCAILGYTDMMLDGLKIADPLHADLMEIKRVSERAAELTRGLLAFSRNQVLAPRVLELGAVIRGVESMLQRLIGEDIELRTDLTETPWQTKADPSQIEQVIMNLAVNARDAMPNGGKLTIEVANIVFEDEYSHREVSIQPGQYVMLAISDSGYGMTDDVKEHLFEPFFTTKDQGKGTGLGLSMVYGIVKQSGGEILVYSEVGRGTTFKVYFPRVDGAADDIHMPAPSKKYRGGTETILVAEDEEVLRALITRILEFAGYNVIQAASGNDAFIAYEEHAGKIDLLITDVVMPGMNGRELSERLTQLQPGLKVLFTSGYTDDLILHHGVLEPGTAFVQKPFSASALAIKVRQVLDQE